MFKNHNLILNVTSTTFVALFFAALHFELDKIERTELASDEEFVAILVSMEAFTLQEVLGLLCETEDTLMSIAIKEGIYFKIKREYTALIEHLIKIIENPTGEEA